MKKSIFLILSFTWGLSLTICGCLAGIFLFREKLTLRQWIGLGIILPALALLNL